MPDGGSGLFLPEHPLAPARWVKQELFASLTGYTVKAQRHKMDDGVWVEGVVWKTAPDGHRLVNLDGYYRWVEGR